MENAEESVRIDEHSLDLLELAIHGTPGKKYKPAEEISIQTPQSGRSTEATGIIPVNDENLLSPEIAFKTNFSKKAKKKVTFDNFRSRLGSQKVAAFDGNLDNLNQGELPHSPLENRKVKQKSPAKKSPDKDESRAPKGKVKTRCRSLSRKFISAYSFMAKGLWILFVKQCKTTLPFIYFGLITAFISDILPSGPKYNVLVLLVLLAAVEFDKFPEKSVRPSIVIFTLVLFSSILDIQLLLLGPASSPVAIAQKTLIGYTLISKAAAIYLFLNEGRHVARARKYITR
jgi:hypothetical protein